MDAILIDLCLFSVFTNCLLCDVSFVVTSSFYQNFDQIKTLDSYFWQMIFGFNEQDIAQNFEATCSLLLIFAQIFSRMSMYWHIDTGYLSVFSLLIIQKLPWISSLKLQLLET